MLSIVSSTQTMLYGEKTLDNDNEQNIHHIKTKLNKNMELLKDMITLWKDSS
jgi:hypothetical protein